MSWPLKFRPEVELDIARAASWYQLRELGLGRRFVAEVERVWQVLAENPFLNSKRHPTLDLRWRFTEHFPYRVIYQISESEKSVLVIAVLHAARHDRHWRRRV